MQNCHFCNYSAFTTCSKCNHLVCKEHISHDDIALCIKCNPNETVERKIDMEIDEAAQSRKELGRVFYMLGEQPTPEQIEQEIFKERELIVNMTLAELEIHIDELDKLYIALQNEAKKIKVKTIAALEGKRERGPKKKVKELKDEKESSKIDDLIRTIMASKGSRLTIKEEEKGETI